MTIKTYSEHGCFGGTVGFYGHDSKVCLGEMKFSVYQPPQALKGPTPVLYYLSGLTCTPETFMTKSGAQVCHFGEKTSNKYLAQKSF